MAASVLRIDYAKLGRSRRPPSGVVPRSFARSLAIAQEASADARAAIDRAGAAAALLGELGRRAPVDHAGHCDIDSVKASDAGGHHGG